MKKILMTIMLGLIFNTAAFSQWYLGGTGSLGFNSHYPELSLEPTVGYEFNDKIALQFGAGFLTTFTSIEGTSQLWARYTPWHNDIVYIDLLGGGDIIFGDRISTLNLGIRPQLRFRVHPQVDFSVYAGLFGATYYSYYTYVDGQNYQMKRYWAPVFGVTGNRADDTSNASFGTSLGFSVVYRF